MTTSKAMIALSAFPSSVEEHMSPNLERLLAIEKAKSIGLGDGFNLLDPSLVQAADGATSPPVVPAKSNNLLIGLAVGATVLLGGIYLVNKRHGR